MSTFERFAVERLLKQATNLGVPIPAELTRFVGQLDCSSYPARVWAEQHPDHEDLGCCWGTTIGGPEKCTCWTAEYDVEQAQPVMPASPAEIVPRDRMCGDCAFKPGSQERADAYTREALLELPAQGDPFWCHDGMRRPARWVHPDGRVVPGSPDDWQPPNVNGIPFRADGRVGLLCAGWAALAAKATAEPASPLPRQPAPNQAAAGNDPTTS